MRKLLIKYLGSYTYATITPGFILNNTIGLFILILYYFKFLSLNQFIISIIGYGVIYSTFVGIIEMAYPTVRKLFFTPIKTFSPIPKYLMIPIGIFYFFIFCFFTNANWNHATIIISFYSVIYSLSFCYFSYLPIQLNEALSVFDSHVIIRTNILAAVLRGEDTEILFDEYFSVYEEYENKLNSINNPNFA